MKKVIQYFILMLLTCNVINSQTLLDEKFEGTAMPVGWTFQSTTADPEHTWTFYDAYDDLEVYVSSTAPQNEWVISPSYDLSSFSNIYLSFSPWIYFNREDFVANTADFKVLVSTNNGLSWTEIWTENDLNTSNFDGAFFYNRTISKSLQSFCGAGKPSVKIGFQFTSKGIKNIFNYNGVYIMDVKLSTDCPVTTLSTLSTTAISWFPITNFMGTFDIEYGAIGFTQGTGTLVTGLTGTTYNFPSTRCNYDCYIRTNCGGTTSIWSKMTFRNNIQDLFNTNTTSNTNQINWTGYTSNYDIEYGIGTFTQGTGTMLSNVSGFTYTLNGLTPNTTYKYYIRSNCGGVLGSWRNMTFKTATLSLREQEIRNKIKIFPNPTSSILNIQSIDNVKFDKITVTDLTGRKVLEQQNTTQINVHNLAKGMYIVEAVSGAEKFMSKFAKE